MIDANKLQYFTMAAWMRGYAAGLDEYEDKNLIYKLKKPPICWTLFGASMLKSRN